MGLRMSFQFIRIKCWRTKKGWLLVSSISVSGKDECGSSHGEEGSPRSRVYCSSHLSAHTSSFFQVWHSHQAQQVCKEQDQEDCRSLGIMPLVSCCWFHLFLLDFIYPFNLPLFAQDHEDWIALGTIQQCRLGTGYRKALREEEGVEGAGKKE